MVFTTAMEMMNGFHYCYGDEEWFSLPLWRRGMVFTTAMETRKGLHYCYRDEEWFTLLLWRQGMFHTTAMETRNGLHYCYVDYIRHLWNYNAKYKLIYIVFWIILYTYGIIMRNKNHMYCVFQLILDTYGIIMEINIIYIVCFGLF